MFIWRVRFACVVRVFSVVARSREAREALVRGVHALLEKYFQM